MRWTVLLGLACQAADGETGQGADVPGACEAVDGPCDEERRVDLNLRIEPWQGEEPVAIRLDGEERIRLDASGGGPEGALEMSWLYMGIGVDGWRRVTLNDREADESVEWDLALRRQQIRLNSGSSGPGCTQGLAMIDWGWDSLIELPEGLIFSDESFYSDECVLVEGATGLPGMPRMVVDGWWRDQDCVAMTGQIAVIRPVVGGAIKMQILSYYESGQEGCDAGEGGARGGGLYEIRWQWLGSPG
jgi:hypothetical protein